MTADVSSHGDAAAATFHRRYAERASHFRPSPVRSVFDISMQPGMISLAGGNPDLAALPLRELGDAAGRLIAERGMEVLQYGAGAGLDVLRPAVCEVMREAGIEARAEQVLITSGSQMGLELLTALLCDPGDVVLAEGPTYVGALGTFQGFEAEVVHVACDDNGLIPEALLETIRAVRAQGKRISFLYTIPNFGNPSGVSLSAERRPEVVAICAAEGVTIVEDDPYGRIAYDGLAPAALRSLDPNIIYLGSLSKIFSPGLRIGWVLAPSELHGRLQLAGEATTIHASILGQHLAHAYLTEFDWRDHLRVAISSYRERRDAMLAALDEFMPDGVSWTHPAGGFFVWVTLPDGMSSEELLRLAIDEHVVFVNGSAFYAVGERAGERQFRLSFSFEDPQTIREGVRRLASAVRRLVPAEVSEAG